VRLPVVDVPDKSDHAWQALRDQEARLWEHALLQDELFVGRSNFFLVAESLLVVAYTGILGLSLSVHAQPLRLRVAALVLAIFGCLLTVIWVFVNGRQRQVLVDLHKRARETFPEYRRTIEERKLPGGRISGTFLIAFGVPVLAAIMWLIFVIIASLACRPCGQRSILALLQRLRRTWMAPPCSASKSVTCKGPP